MEQLVSNSVSRRRLYTVILDSLAGYGTSAGRCRDLRRHRVFPRPAYTRDRHPPRARSARHSQIIALVLGQTVMLTVLGGVLGTAGAAAVTRYLEGMLFGVTPLDPSTFIGIWILLACVAAAAAVIPAHRVVRIDPIRAIRCE